MSPVEIPVAVWTAIGGGIVGGAVNELRQLIQARREVRRTLHRLLYAQLDVWWVLQRPDALELLEFIARTLANRLGVSENQLREQYASDPVFRRVLSNLLPQALPPQLETRYQQAVEGLSETNSILAYELDGRTELTRYVSVFQEALELSHSALSPKEVETALRVEPILFRAIRNNVVSSFESDITVVARALGWGQVRRVRRTLSKVRKLTDQSLEDEFRPI